MPVEEKLPQTEQANVKKFIEFLNFDDTGSILEKAESYSFKLEDIDHNEKISRSIFFK